MNKAKGEGRAAFEAKRPVKECPYPKGTDDRTFWVAGWVEAFYEWSGKGGRG
jgi:ribosome modulation factor